jgi:Flp pilus assembly protein TadD
LIAALAVTAALVWQRRNFWLRPLLLAWTYFAIALLPLLGLVDVGFMQYSLVADHYQYVALTAALSISAAGCTIWFERTRGGARWTIPLGAAILIAIWLNLARQQAELFGQPARLYALTLERNPECWAAHNNLGILFDEAGMWPEAVDRFQEALRLKPGWSMALYNLGNSLSNLGRSDEAIRAYRKALESDPKNFSIHNNLGKALLDVKQPTEARQEFQRAVQLEPDFPEAHCNLGMVLLDADQGPQAVLEFQQAISQRRDYLKAWERLGEANRHLHNYVGAIDATQQALALARANGQAALVERLEIQLAKDRSDLASSPASSSSSSNGSKRGQ